MSDLTAFIDQAWQDHGDDPRGVADRLPQALALVADDNGLLGLIGLAHHVLGEHLGAWQEGLDYGEQLRALPVFDAVLNSGASLSRVQAALKLSGALADERAALSTSDQVRVTVMAAANLASRDATRAASLLQQACDDALAAALPASDPAPRSIAASANGIAGTLEEKPARTTGETALMLAAAEAARRFWEVAGTWLEVERAEYRLAMSCTQAGQLERARGHAQQCLAIAQAHDSVALEAFFGFEALAVVERAAGNAAAFAAAVSAARVAFARLSEGDVGWCQASLDKLLVGQSQSP